METIHKSKAEKNRVKVIEDQATAAKAKASVRVDRKSKSKAVTKLAAQ